MTTNIELDKSMKSILGIMLIAVLGGVVVGMMTPPRGNYCDPFDPNVCFNTPEELEEYFREKYPTVDINIIWQ